MSKATATRDLADLLEKGCLRKLPGGGAQLEVALDQETVWLSQAQICTLFGRDQSVVSRHIRNVFKEGELPEKSNMQKMHIAKSDKPTAFYSLDAIISIGYRVKSQRGVQFRQWATKTLKDHLVEGYTLNQRRLAERGIEFEQAVSLLSRTLTNQGLVSTEGEAVARVISDYARSWSLLQGYDDQQLAEVGIHQPNIRPLELRAAHQRQYPSDSGPVGCGKPARSENIDDSANRALHPAEKTCRRKELRHGEGFS